MYSLSWCCFRRVYYTFCSIIRVFYCVKWRHVCDYSTRIADEFVSIFFYFFVNHINLVFLSCSFQQPVDVFHSWIVLKRNVRGLFGLHTRTRVGILWLPLKIMQQKSRLSWTIRVCCLVRMHHSLILLKQLSKRAV